MNEYFYDALCAGAVLAFLYCSISLCQFLFMRKNSRHDFLYFILKAPFVALLGFYCYMVLGITILSRNERDIYIILLTPFSTWGLNPKNLTFWIENILMMIPLGILLYILWKPFRKIGWLLLSGFLFSLLIECIQLVSRRGKFETDDIMNNVFGMLLGFGLCRGMEWIYGVAGKMLYAYVRNSYRKKKK
ncbi:MAG: VanZ family protein [Muribaculaceae bacterium]|nr:VanZ family protein [Muribaculaceae bacterium]